MPADEPIFDYDLIAERYAAHTDASPYNALYERPAVLDLLPPVAGARVLDAGCGAGWYSARLAALGAQVTGLDSSEAMLRHARARLHDLPAGAPPARLLRADLGAPLDLPDAGFDGVVSGLVMHYLRDWEPAFRELRRVLRPGGWLVFSTHHPITSAMSRDAPHYFQVEAVEDEWESIGTVRYYRRSLTAMVEPLARTGFLIERIVEPQPGEAFRQARPDAYQRLLRAPEFIVFRAHASVIPAPAA